MQTEFEFINNLKHRYGLTKIGDDAAVLPKDDKTDLVISADMLVEDIDFRLEWSKPEFIGSKAKTVSVSDIHAMGGLAKYSMVSIGIPEKLWKTNFVDRFYEGYLEDRIELIGGDISKSPDKVVIDSIVLGEVEKGKAILRSTSKVGDLIFVTGELGGASAGLRLLENGVRYDDSATTWQRNIIIDQLKPRGIGNPTNPSKFASSMIDISDGLSSDLMHICTSSKVGAKVYADKIPIDRKLIGHGVNNFKEFLSENLDVLDFALHGGEDFELLFTIDPSKLKKFEKNISGHFTHIGEITENVGKIELIQDKQSTFLQPKGFQHF